MKEILIKNKIVILRVLGAIMLIIGFSVQFWSTPKEGFTQNEIAARNVARMEANVRGTSSSRASTSSSAKIIKELKNTQKKQMKYLTIIAMILGVGFLGYSFIKPRQDVKLDSEK